MARTTTMRLGLPYEILLSRRQTVGHIDPTRSQLVTFVAKERVAVLGIL
jgi:hypothetical protein